MTLVVQISTRVVIYCTQVPSDIRLYMCWITVIRTVYKSMYVCVSVYKVMYAMHVWCIHVDILNVWG